jgi:hypothetical protein
MNVPGRKDTWTGVELKAEYEPVSRLRISAIGIGAQSTKSSTCTNTRKNINGG